MSFLAWESQQATRLVVAAIRDGVYASKRVDIMTHALRLLDAMVHVPSILPI